MTVFLVLFWSVQTTFAAEVFLAPTTGSYNIGQTFTVVVKFSPDSTTGVDIVKVSLKFDPELFSVVGLSKNKSVLSQWTSEPTFSNLTGEITFAGKSSSPLVLQSSLLNITFKAISVGSTRVDVTTASVFSVDGNELDVYGVSGDGVYNITLLNGVVTDVPSVPLVSSKSFNNPEIWYQTTEGIFTWELPFGVDMVAIELATSSNNHPEEYEAAVYDPPITKFNITKEIIYNGISYLNIKYKNQIGWGTVLNRKIQIDTIPPEEFSIQVKDSNQKTDFPALNFSTVDTTSGIDYYDVIVANKEPVKITPNEAQLGYQLSELKDGAYTVIVVAHDKAGNRRESIITIPVTAGWIEPITTAPKMLISDFFTIFNILFILLFLFVILQFTHLRHIRTQNHLREEKLRRETFEIQDQMEKIFSALRDEIYDQIKIITKRKRLAKNEREAVDGLNQALEVSETLLGKEINDVKSILK